MGGAGTLIGPTVGAAIWLSLRDVLQQVPAVGSLWQFILGAVFVLLVTFHAERHCRHNHSADGARAPAEAPAATGTAQDGAAMREALLAPLPLIASPGGSPANSHSKPMMSASPTAAFSAVNEFSLALPEGTLHAIIGPNGAGKSTFLRLLKREEAVEFRPHSPARPRHHGHRRHCGVSVWLVQKLSDQSTLPSTDRAAELAARRARPPTGPLATRRFSSGRWFRESRSAGRRACGRTRIG